MLEGDCGNMQSAIACLEESLVIIKQLDNDQLLAGNDRKWLEKITRQLETLQSQARP
jgi:hypothetical protein